MPTSSIGYVWMPNLGCRRRPVEGSKHVAALGAPRERDRRLRLPDWSAALDPSITLREGHNRRGGTLPC